MAFLGVLAHTAGDTLRETGSNLREGLRGVADSEREARRKAFGPAVDAVDRIRQAIPPGSEYFLVTRGAGGILDLLLFDLAPRRALYLGPGPHTLARLRERGRQPGDPAWVVVAGGPFDPPELLTLDEALRTDP